MTTRHVVRQDGRFAYKEFTKLKCFMMEKKALEVLEPHPFVTQMIDSYMEDHLCIIQMTFYDGCDVHTWIRRKNITAPRFVCHVAKKVLLALDYAERHHIWHRDIKPENIMIDQHGIVKLIDWELCSFRIHSRSYVGTKEYMPPEIFHRVAYNCQKVDMWCLGVTVFCMLTGIRPYGNLKGLDVDHFEDEYVQAMFCREWDLLWRSFEQKSSFPTLPRNIKDFLQALLCVRPDERPSIIEAMEMEALYDHATTSELKAELATV